jgi:hypothetical protein
VVTIERVLIAYVITDGMTLIAMKYFPIHLAATTTMVTLTIIITITVVAPTPPIRPTLSTTIKTAMTIEQK